MCCKFFRTRPGNAFLPAAALLALSLCAGTSAAAVDPAALREALQERVTLLREGRLGPVGREPVTGLLS